MQSTTSRAPAGSAGPPGGRARRLTRALLAGSAVAVVIMAIAFLIRSEFDPLVRLDEGVIASATSFTRDRPALRSALIVWQEISQPLGCYLVATLVCVWVWLAKRLKTRAWWAFLTMMAGWSIALGIKYLVQRARPVVEDAVSHAPGYSFPSGHAANAAVLATALVLLLWPLLGRTGRGIAVVLGVLHVLVTSLDRVFLGVHYPSDVAAGVLLGCGLVGASYLGFLGWTPTGPATEDPSTTPDPQ